MKRLFVLALASFAIACGGTARACNIGAAQQPGFAPVMLPQNPIALRSPVQANASKAVVGTWLVNYEVNGNTIQQALVQWHSDGTEWQSVNQPVDDGNVCLGSWTTIDARHVSRYHMGWTYNAGSLSGYIVETETDRVTAKGSYDGTFDTKVYDVNGNLVNEITGSTVGAKLQS